MVFLNSYSGGVPEKKSFWPNLNGGEIASLVAVFSGLEEFLQRLSETPHVFCKLEWRS